VLRQNDKNAPNLSPGEEQSVTPAPSLGTASADADSVEKLAR